MIDNVNASFLAWITSSMFFIDAYRVQYYNMIHNPLPSPILLMVCGKVFSAIYSLFLTTPPPPPAVMYRSFETVVKQNALDIWMIIQFKAIRIFVLLIKLGSSGEMLLERMKSVYKDCQPYFDFIEPFTVRGKFIL